MGNPLEMMASAAADETALLVMHVQEPMTGMVGASIVDQIARAVAGARGAGVPVIYAYTGYRSGYPELAQDAPYRPMIVNNGLFIDGVANVTHPKVAPQEGDPMIRTPRVGAFFATDLDVILRAKGIKHLVLTGISTRGVVLTTLIHALQSDYKVTVLTDGSPTPTKKPIACCSSRSQLGGPGSQVQQLSTNGSSPCRLEAVQTNRPRIPATQARQVVVKLEIARNGKPHALHFWGSIPFA